MELWDIYDNNKQLTGRTMKRNDWCLKDGEYHLTVLGVVQHTDGRFLITRRVLTKAWAAGWWEVPGGACMAGGKLSSGRKSRGAGGNRTGCVCSSRRAAGDLSPGESGRGG